MSNVSVVSSMKWVAPENRINFYVMFLGQILIFFPPFSNPFLYKMSGT